MSMPEFRKKTMSWDESLRELFALRSEKALYDAGAKPLLEVVDAYLMPDDLRAACALGAEWPYHYNGIPTNFLASACANLVAAYKEGEKRQDGSPSIVHEYSQIYYLHALRTANIDVYRPDIVACIVALHDLGEEYGLTPDGARNYLIEAVDECGFFDQETLEKNYADIDEVVRGFEIMSRDIEGYKAKLSKFEYTRQTLFNPYTSIAKPLDRVHNIATLSGAVNAKGIGKKIDETGLLFMTPIYKIEGVPEPMKYFEAASYLHPQNEEAYLFLSTLIGTALNLHIANRVNRTEFKRKGHVVLDNPEIMIEDRLRQPRMPRVLRPLRLLSQRAQEVAHPANE